MIDLAAEVGEMGHAKRRLRELKAEREVLASEAAQARAYVPTLEELMPAIHKRLEDLEGMLKEDVPRGRLALGSLLGEKRLRVYPGGRIEGMATLRANELAAPSGSSGRRVSVVAGAGFEPATCGL